MAVILESETFIGSVVRPKKNDSIPGTLSIQKMYVYGTQLFNGVHDHAPPHGNQFCKLVLKLAPGRHTVRNAFAPEPHSGQRPNLSIFTLNQWMS